MPSNSTRLCAFQTGGMGCETVFFSDGAADAAFFEVILVTSSIMRCFGKVSTMRQFLHKSAHVKTAQEPENFEQVKQRGEFYLNAD